MKNELSHRAGRKKLEPSRRSLTSEEREKADAATKEIEFAFVKDFIRGDGSDLVPISKLSQREMRRSFEEDEAEAVKFATQGNFRPLIHLLSEDCPYSRYLNPPPRNSLSDAAWTHIIPMLGGKLRGKRGPKPKSPSERAQAAPIHDAAELVPLILHAIRIHRTMGFKPENNEMRARACEYAARLTNNPRVTKDGVFRYVFSRSLSDRHRIKR